MARVLHPQALSGEWSGAQSLQRSPRGPFHDTTTTSQDAAERFTEIWAAGKGEMVTDRGLVSTKDMQNEQVALLRSHRVG